VTQHALPDDEPTRFGKKQRVIAAIVAVVVVAAVAVAVGLSSGGNDMAEPTGASTQPSSTSSSVSSTTTTTMVPFIAPLTGIPQTAGALLTRPALTVKIDGAPSAMPQIGMDVADVVWEEQVEGGAVRYLAMFHSTDAAVVGPVRSVRPVDPDIIGPSGGLFAYSGGIQVFVNKLRATPGIEDIGASVNGDDYYRRKGRKAPHNLFSSTTDLYAGAPELPAAKDIFEHYAPTENASFGGTTGVATAVVTAKISTLTTTSWTWDPATSLFKRGFNGSPHVNESGEPLAFTNVVLVLTPYVNSGEFDPVGSPVPEGKIIGTGDGYVLSGGKAVKVRWTKPNATTPITFTDTTGLPVKLMPGRTWASLVPTTGAITVG